jgi:predicted dehydrogenase
LRMPEIDVVDICLPLRLHYDWTKRALQAGKHVLLEKPMVLDPAQGGELIDLARKNGRIFMVAHVVRFMPAYRTLRNIVNDGQFGPLEFIIMQRWAGEPAWGTWKDAEVRRSSGGGLFDLLIHDIDIVHWLLGRPSRIQSSVFAGAVSDHDFVNAVWHYDSGPAAVLDGGFAFHTRLPFEARFLARFKRATVAFDSTRPGVLSIADEHECQSMTLEEDPLDGYRREIEYFIQCVRKQRWPDECEPESSLEAVELALSHLPGK